MKSNAISSQQRKKSKAKKTSQPTKDKCNSNSNSSNNNNNNNNTKQSKVDGPRIKSNVDEIKPPIVTANESIVEQITPMVNEINSEVTGLDVKQIANESNAADYVDNQQIELVESQNEPVVNEMDLKPITIKHPLNSKWTLWYFFPEKHRDWEDCQHQIHTVFTIEDFWSFFNHLKSPSELISGVDYSFFKNGIHPAWEDPQNVHGGRLAIKSDSRANSSAMDELWLEILIFLIGEKGPYADDVAGVVLNVRTYGFKVWLWTSTSDQNRINTIKSSIRNTLNMHNVQKMIFEAHYDNKNNKPHNQGRSSTKQF